MDNGDSTNLLGAALEEGGIPVVWSGGRGGVAADALSEPSRRGLVVPGSLYPPPGGGPNLPDLFTKTPVASSVPGRGLPGRGLKSDQPPGSLCALPRAGHNSDPGGV